MTNNNNKYKPMSHGLENPSMNLSIVIGKKKVLELQVQATTFLVTHP